MAGAASPLANLARLGPLSAPQMVQVAKALAQTQTGPTIDALQAQIGQNDRQTAGALSQVGGLYQGLGQQAQQGLTATQGIGNDLNTRLAGIGQDEQAQLKGIGDSALASLMKYAPQDDKGNSLAQPALASLTSEMARQQGLAAQNQGAFKSFGATQGANYNDLAASQLGTFAKAGQEALRGIAAAGQTRNAPLSSRLASAISQRGALESADLAKLRQQQIANRISEAGLGIRQETANAGLLRAETGAKTAAFNSNPNAKGSPAWARTKTAATQAFNTNPLAVGSAAWARVQNTNGKQWSDNPNAVGSPAWARAMKTSASSDPSGQAKPLSTHENNHFWQTMGQIEQLIQNGQQQSGATEQGIRSALQSGSNPSKKSFDPFMVDVAYQLLGYGGINPQTAQVLHNQYGVRGGTFRSTPIRVGKYGGVTQNTANQTNQAVNQVLGGL